MQTIDNWRANLLLLLTAMIWGFSFVAQRQGMEHVQPFTFNGLRFAIGSLSLLSVILFIRRKPVKRDSSAAFFRAIHVQFSSITKKLRRSRVSRQGPI